VTSTYSGHSSESTEHVRLPVAETRGGGVEFDRPDGAAEALRAGAFLLRMPDDLDPAPGLDLCRRFYLPPVPGDRYRGHREHGHPASKLGYEDRPDQVEQLQIEAHLWQRYFPEEVTSLLERMEEITGTALHALLSAAGVPAGDADEALGGHHGGLCYTTVNHYRGDLDRRVGIVEHTDSGYITLFHADQPGFEVLDNGRWTPIELPERHFVVNLGDAFDVLTRHLPHPGTAVLHRVAAAGPGQPDRSSFTIYMGPSYDMVLRQYTSDGELVDYQSFRDFSVAKAARMGYQFHDRI